MSTHQQAVTRTALYRLYDAGDRLLYVGISSNVKARWRAHERDKHWWPEVARKTVEWFETRKSAARVEKLEIQEEGPLYNKALNGSERRTQLYNQELARNRPAAVQGSSPQAIYPPFHGVPD